MFGFLKKKLQESVKAIAKVIKKEEEIEKVEEAVEEVEKEFEAKEEIAYKEKLIEEAGYKLKPEIREIVEKPYEKIPKEREEGLIEKVKKRIAEKKLTEKDIKDVLWNIQISLIQSDVAVEVAEKICADLKNALIGKSIKRGQIEKIVKESLEKSILEILKVPKIDLIEEVKKKKPYLILFLGFNGSGKTTSLAKVGYFLQKQEFKVIFAAADCFRAASIEQIEEHGKNIGIKIIKHKYGADPAAVVFDSKKYGEAHDIDFILADSAGRSHTDINLVEELKKICRVNKPDLKILVLDSLVGNDATSQSLMFDKAVGVDAIIFTKADVYEKGGALLSATHTINKPIIFIGTGQGYNDLESFDPEKIIKSLLS